MQFPAPRRAGLPNWIYVLVVAALAVYFIIGAVAWVIIAYEGRTFRTRSLRSSPPLPGVW